jgi:sec-independent protein translocase protein TatA
LQGKESFDTIYLDKTLHRESAMGSIGLPELIVIFVIILLLFGARRLPQIARSIGKSLREFKSGMKSQMKDTEEEEEREEEREEKVTAAKE